MLSPDVLEKWRRRAFGPRAVPVRWPDNLWRIYVEDALRGRAWYLPGEWPTREEAARAALLWEWQNRQAS